MTFLIIGQVFIGLPISYCPWYEFWLYLMNLEQKLIIFF